MNLKEKYELVVKHFAQQPVGSFTIYEVEKIPDFMNDETKAKLVNGNYVFNYVLTDKATEKDYQDYIDYVLTYTGQDLKNYIIDDPKQFSKFGK